MLDSCAFGLIFERRRAGESMTVETAYCTSDFRACFYEMAFLIAIVASFAVHGAQPHGAQPCFFFFFSCFRE